jgi:hypothetical protein
MAFWKPVKEQERRAFTLAADEDHRFTGLDRGGLKVIEHVTPRLLFDLSPTHV